MPLMLLGGCHTPPPWGDTPVERVPVTTENLTPGPEAEGPGDGPFRDSWSGGVTAMAAQHPAVPHTGLQLPVVSRDGKWLAYLHSDEAPVYPPTHALVTGRGLDSVSLSVRPLERDEPHLLSTGGACWPTWAPRHNRLVFVSYDAQRRAYLGVYDVNTRELQRKGVGLRHLMMPAVSPDGRTVAVAGYGNVPDQSLIFLVDLDQATAVPGPPPTPGRGAQVWPYWLNRSTLLYVELGGADQGRARLMAWTRDTETVRALADLDAPDNAVDAIQLFAGVAAPLRRDGEALLYFNPRHGALSALDLATAEELMLNPGTIAGVWWSAPWTVTGAPENAELTIAGANGGNERRRSLRLLPGRWAPRWADPVQKSVILVGDAGRPDRLALYQLWLLVSDDTK